MTEIYLIYLRRVDSDKIDVVIDDLHRLDKIASRRLGTGIVTSLTCIATICLSFFTKPIASF